MKLDAQTIRDLELVQGSAGGQSVFEFLDRTTTDDGRRSFKHRLLNPLDDVQAIRDTQDVVRHLMRTPSGPLIPVNQSDLDQLRRYLEHNFEVPDVAPGWSGTVALYWLTWRNPEYLDFARRGIRLTLDFLERLERFADALAQGDPPAATQRFIVYFRRCIEMEPLSSLIAEVRRDPGGFSLSRPDVVCTDRLLRAALKATLLETLDRVVDLDGLLSMARATTEIGLVLPEIVREADSPCEITGVWHPFVATPVGNDCVFGKGRHVMFLTGPNMAGKTTYVKATGLSILLAQAGMGVPARRMRLVPFARVFCSLNAIDDIHSGVSSFCSEIRRVKEVVLEARAGGRVFAIFDELFKGTNVKDALDCSREVMVGLADLQHHVFIVSSHLLELHDSIGHRPELMFSHFDAQQDGDRVRFDYLLRPGINHKRFGYELLKQEGLLQLLSPPARQC